MKYQTLFSRENNKKKKLFKLLSVAFFFFLHSMPSNTVHDEGVERLSRLIGFNIDTIYNRGRNRYNTKI